MSWNYILSPLRPEGSFSNIFILFVRLIPAYLHLGTLQHCTGGGGGILNSKITKNKNAENIAPNRWWKGHLFTVWELKWEGRASSPCSASAGNMGVRKFKIFAALCMSVNSSESTVSFNLGTASKCQWVGEFADMESMKNEDQPVCLLVFRCHINRHLGRHGEVGQGCHLLGVYCILCTVLSTLCFLGWL